MCVMIRMTFARLQCVFDHCSMMIKAVVSFVVQIEAHKQLWLTIKTVAAIASLQNAHAVHTDLICLSSSFFFLSCSCALHFCASKSFFFVKCYLQQFCQFVLRKREQEKVKEMP